MTLRLYKEARKQGFVGKAGDVAGKVGLTMEIVGGAMVLTEFAAPEGALLITEGAEMQTLGLSMQLFDDLVREDLKSFKVRVAIVVIAKFGGVGVDKIIKNEAKKFAAGAGVEITGEIVEDIVVDEKDNRKIETNGN